MQGLSSFIKEEKGDGLEVYDGADTGTPYVNTDELE